MRPISWRRRDHPGAGGKSFGKTVTQPGAPCRGYIPARPAASASLFLLLLIWAAAVGAAAMAAAAELREATLAKVGDRLVLLSDLHDEWRLSQVENKQLALALGQAPDRSALEPVFQKKIDQLVVLNYLDNLGLWQEMRREQAKEMEGKFTLACGGREQRLEFLKKSGISRARLLQLLWERRRVQLFAEEKFRSEGGSKTANFRDWLAKQRASAASAGTLEILPWKPPQPGRE